MGGTITKAFRWRQQQQQVNIFMLGLYDVGKTTALYQLKLGEVVTTIPTIGFSIETVETKTMKLSSWDLGGRCSMRPLFRYYFANADGVIFMVDSSDKERMEEAKDELRRSVLEMEQLDGTPLLIVANKQNVTGHMEVQDIADALGLNAIRHRQWYIVPAVAATGEGLFEGLQWLSDAIAQRKSRHELKSFTDTGAEKLAENYASVGRSWSWFIKQTKHYLAPAVKST